MSIRPAFPALSGSRSSGRPVASSARFTPVIFSIFRIISYLWLRLRYSRSAMFKLNLHCVRLIRIFVHKVPGPDAKHRTKHNGVVAPVTLCGVLEQCHVVSACPPDRRTRFRPFASLLRLFGQSRSQPHAAAVPADRALVVADCHGGDVRRAGFRAGGSRFCLRSPETRRAVRYAGASLRLARTSSGLMFLRI